MSVEIKIGTLDEFFASALETAKEIDSGMRITPKNRIWLDKSDISPHQLNSPQSPYIATTINP